MKEKPNGIGDFLADYSPESENTQIHIPTKPQVLKSKEQRDELGRLHIQIRKDLIDKLIETVYKRKAAQKTKRRNATQRAVIEEALESFFDKMPPDLTMTESDGNVSNIESK